MNSQSKMALMISTLTFAANFSIWTLYAVLGVHLSPSLDLSATQYGLLVASPIITGALLRLPAGYLCQFFSSRNLFIWQMILTLPPLFFLNYAQDFNDYVLVGLFLGLSGTSFTLGIRYVSQWFESNKQGMAMGVFGAGNAGAAITLIIAPLIIEQFGLRLVGPLFALGMMFVIVLFMMLAPHYKHEQNNTEPTSLKQELSLLGHLNVWRFGLYYYFVFGSFLALLLWLPLYYVNVYQLSTQEALAWTLVFATSSSLVRAIGGWYSDMYGGRTVNWWVFWICLVCLFFLSYPPTTMVIHGVDRDVNISININLTLFNVLIIIIGLAQGFGRASVYKIIHDYYPNHMGSVGGTVAMIGGLGGFTLPILFGLAVDMIGVYSASFMLLYGVVAFCMLAMYFAIRSDKYKRRMESALNNDFLQKVQQSTLK
jgi:NNP family nitrate/nitrite transporter-like MFS transporter